VCVAVNRRTWRTRTARRLPATAYLPPLRALLHTQFQHHHGSRPTTPGLLPYLPLPPSTAQPLPRCRHTLPHTTPSCPPVTPPHLRPTRIPTFGGFVATPGGWRVCVRGSASATRTTAHISRHHSSTTPRTYTHFHRAAVRATALLPSHRSYHSSPRSDKRRAACSTAF